MKIFKLKDAKEAPKTGFVLKTLAEIDLGQNVSSVGFFRPDVPASGTLRNHYHENLTEFMIFLTPTKIKIGSKIFDLAAGDLAVIPPGEAHEVLAGPEGTMPIVIKLPSNPADTKYSG